MYDGEWRQDRAQGFGEYFFSNGDSYRGEWMEDKMSGVGVYQRRLAKEDKEGGRSGPDLYYEGQWLNGLKHGAGIEVFKDGRRVEGFWLKGKLVKNLAQEESTPRAGTSSSKKVRK